MHGIIIFLHFNFIILTSAFNCSLPNGCEINNVHLQMNLMAREKSSVKIHGILCDIRDEKFQFTFQPLEPLECVINEFYINEIEFRFHSNFILSKQFDFTSLLRYSLYLNSHFYISFVNLKGFELDTTNVNHEITQSRIYYFYCVKCNIEFYSNGRLVKTCQDIIDSDSKAVIIRSFFQSNPRMMALIDSQFKTTLCPLVFSDSKIERFSITGLADTFYKRNILAFENRTFFDLDSTIYHLFLIKIEHLNIDGNLLNPSVFQNLKFIYMYGSVNMIDGSSLNSLQNIKGILFAKDNYRDMIHKNGIKWIRDLNPDLDVNLNNTNFEELKYRYDNNATLIFIETDDYNTEIRLSKLFPEKDFCLYKDFPFNQLVILTEFAQRENVFALLNSTSDYTCTYLWLAQYFNLYLRLNTR